MQVFGKKTPLQEFEAELAKLTRQSERLARKTADARSELQRATEAQIKFLTETEHDDAKGEASAQRRVEAATSTLKGLEAAFAKINEQISEAQHRVDQERRGLERTAAADEIDQKVLAFEKTVEPALTALRAFSKASNELDHLNFDVAAISRYAHVAGSELEIASALAIAEIRSKAAAVRAGQDGIPRRAPAPIPPPPPPVTEKLWTIAATAWTEDGRIRIVDLNEQIDLPPALARKAIVRGAAVALGDARFNKRTTTWRQHHGMGLPSLEKCVKLDDETETVAAEEQARPEEQRVLHSRVDPNFEVIDRGPAYTLKTNSGNATPGEAA
jgi:hypothetical protein